MNNVFLVSVEEESNTDMSWRTVSNMFSVPQCLCFRQGAERKLRDEEKKQLRKKTKGNGIFLHVCTSRNTKSLKPATYCKVLLKLMLCVGQLQNYTVQYKVHLTKKILCFS